MRRLARLALLSLALVALLIMAPGCSGGSTNSGGTGGDDIGAEDDGSSGGDATGTSGDAASTGGDAAGTEEDAADPEPDPEDGGTTPDPEDGGTTPDPDAGPDDDATTPDTGTDNCKNADDGFVFEAIYDTMMEQCGVPCLDDDDTGACLQDCAFQAGFSEGCSACFEGFGTCVGALCGDVCTADNIGDGEGEACGACVDEFCAPDFIECTGLPMFDDEPPAGGDCANPTDGALLDSPDDPSGQCWELCMPEEDTGACMTDCLASAGFTNGCSECMGIFGECASGKCAEECAPEVQAGDDGAACGGCIFTSCAEEFDACFAAPPAPEAGLCVNPEDAALNESGAADACSAVCMEDADPATCTATCHEDAGFSPECSACVGEMMGCMDDNCPGACTDEAFAADEGEACLTCLFETCGVEFMACYNDPNPEPEPPILDGICVANPEDAAIIGAPGDVIGWCWMTCMNSGEFGDCMGDCFQDADFSAECSDCASDFGGCIDATCGAECDADGQAADEGEACGACLEISGCYGIWGQCLAGIENIPEQPGACVNPADNTMSPSAGEALGQCWAMCITDTDPGSCINDCFEGMGFTDGCADCVAAFGTCIDDNCGDVCDGTDPEACDTCVPPACGYHWSVCFAGMEDPQPDEGTCVNPEDGAIMESGAVDDCPTACMDNGDPVGCMAECYGDAGMSPDCAWCAGDVLGCVTENCPDACTQEAQDADDGEACNACLDTDCGPVFAGCFLEPEPEPGPEPGACANEENEAAVAQPGDHVGWCYLSCLGQDDIGPCMASCLDSAGFSDDCSDCAEDFGTCVEVNCGGVCTPEAQADDDGEACGECMGPACGQQYYDCFVGIDEIPEDPGMCVNPNDSALDEAGGDGFGSCWNLCMGADDPDACTEECMLDGGYTEDCADCMGELVACIQGNCAAECTPEAQAADGGEACSTCFFPACYGILMHCTMEPEPEPDAGLCVNPEDGAIMDSGAVDDCPTACMDNDDPTGCMAECYGDAGMSPDCAWCAGEVLACVAVECPESCTQEAQDADDGEACNECLTTTCGAEFAICFDEPEPEPELDIICGGEEDQALLTSEDYNPWACWWSCDGSDEDPESCMTACVEDDGLSPECTDCFGVAAICVDTSCNSECTEEVMLADGGESCGLCTLDYCYETWLTCFGVD